MLVVVMVTMAVMVMVVGMVAEEVKRNNRHAEVEEVEVKEKEEKKHVNYRALEANAQNTARYYFKKYLQTIESITDIELEIKGAPLKVLVGEYTENNAEEIASAWENSLKKLKKEAETYSALNKKYWNVAKTFHNKAMKIA